MSHRRLLPLALCLALPALACVTADPGLAYLCDNSEGGGCPEGTFCGKGTDGKNRCLPTSDAGGPDASAAPSDGSIAPDAAAEPSDAAAEPSDAALGPADASEAARDAGKADGSVALPDTGTWPDAGCAGDSTCPLCQKCQGGTCVMQDVGEDLGDRCPDGLACGTGACNGAGACGVKLATVQCRDPGECDPAEKCDGIHDTCPENLFAPASEVCRSAAGVCDKVEQCSGTGAGCPVDTKLDSTVSCSAASCSGAAWLPEQFCDGANACPTAKPVSCSPYTCAQGQCLVTCKTHAECTTGVCDLRKGECVGNPVLVDCGNSSSDLQDQINNCSPGVACFLKASPGDKCKSVTIEGKDVTIVGALIVPNATGSPNGPAISVIEANAETTVVYLDHVTLQGAVGSGLDVAGTGTGRPEVTITRSTIGGPAASEQNTGSGIKAVNATLTVDGCLVTDHAFSGISLDTTSFDIRNSIIARNASLLSSWAVEIKTSAAITKSFRFNTVFLNGDPSGGGSGGIGCLDASSATNLVASLLFNPGKPEQSGCNVDASSDVRGVSDGCLNGSASPGFVDETKGAAGNYHLAPGSPCIDRAACGGVSVDVDGQARPAGAACDLGADEVQ